MDSGSYLLTNAKISFDTMSRQGRVHAKTNIHHLCLLIVPIFFRIASLAMEQPYDCTIAREATLRDMAQCIMEIETMDYICQSKTKRIKTVYMIPGTYCRCALLILWSLVPLNLCKAAESLIELCHFELCS